MTQTYRGCSPLSGEWDFGHVTTFFSLLFSFKKKRMPLLSTSCDAAFAAAREAECSMDDEACLRKNGIFLSSDACQEAGTTSCVLRGTSKPYFVCTPGAQQETQVVYGTGMRGGPSRIMPQSG